jgi:hypothetical protein
MSSCYLPGKINPYSRAKTTRPVPVDGFRTIVEEIDHVIREALEANEPLFMLIVGQSGTGRSAAAKHVLDRVMEIGGLEPKKFIVPSVDVHYDAKGVLGEWLQFLAILALNGRLANADLQQQTLQTVQVMQAVQDQTFRGPFAGIVNSYVAQVQATNGLFGVLFENVLDASLVKAAGTVFQFAPVPVIFTVEQAHENADKIKAAFDAMLVNHSRTVDLSLLSGDDVARFVDEHWIACAAEGPPPFEREGVKEVFGDRLRPIGYARTLLGRLHNIKLRYEGDKPPWNAKKIAENMPDIVFEDRR